MLLFLVVIGLMYITGFSVVYLMKAKKHALEMGISKEEVIALVYMIALPFIVLGYFGCISSFGEIFNVSTLGILAIYFPGGFS